MKRSVLALVGSLAGLAYIACVAFALPRMASLGVILLRMADFRLQIPPALSYLVFSALANAVNWACFFSKKRGFALASAILYGMAIPFALPAPVLIAGPLALALAALIDFLRTVGPAEGAPSPAPEDDPSLTIDELDLSAEDLALPDDDPEALDEPESPDDADEADGLLDPEDDEGLGEPDDEWPGSTHRPEADGMSVFLGLFTALAVAALLGVVIFGLITGRFPFVP